MRFFPTLTAISTAFLVITNAGAQSAYDRLDRQAFNQLAQEMNVPIFWRADKDQNNTVKPADIVYLWGMRADKKLSDYVHHGYFTQEFKHTYEYMVRRHQIVPVDPDSIQNPEQKRRALVIKELSQARPTLLETDFSNASDEDKTVVKYIVNVADLIDQIFLKQNGAFGWDGYIPDDDTASQTLFFRNHGPFCLNPLTEGNPDCNALPNKLKRVVDVYPASLQANKSFCETIQKDQTLMRPFVSVIEKNGNLETIPYTQRYQLEMGQVANELKQAASAIRDPKEIAFKNYLLAAAQAFVDNNWYAADEAWSKMNALNSKWYLRVGPDEQYWDPCNLKAAFHLSFARINRDSLMWQEKLNPLKDEMEAMLAALAGPPYQARNVQFHLPEFIDIVLNAGDSRSHTGGTLGQSLPNSGPVANEGRGRTVVMTNLSFPDEDSRTQFLNRSAALFCKATMQNVVANPALDNMSTVLHEAAHNLGPAHEYRVNGKTASEIFGGQLASMLEELKAQTSALYFISWLVNKKIIDQRTAEQTYLNDIVWQFGHIARGMYTAEGSIKTYSQLAAIQFGSFLKSGAIVWLPNVRAANGQDLGCLEVNMAKMTVSIASLEKQVLQIKASGDAAGGEALRKEMMDNNEQLKQLHKIIAERVLRAKSATFVYSIQQ